MKPREAIPVEAAAPGPRTAPSWLDTLARLAVIIALLYFASPVLVPLALAVLLTFLLAPVVAATQRVVRHRMAAVLLVVGMAVVAVGGVAFVLSAQVAGLAANIPLYKGNIREKLRAVYPSKDGVVGRISQTIEEISAELGETASSDARATAPVSHGSAASARDTDSATPLLVRVEESPAPSLDVVFAWLAPILTPLVQAGAIVVLVMFMLLHRENLRDRILRLSGRGYSHITMRAMNDAAQRVSDYLLTQGAVNAIYGSVAAVGLVLLGVPNALLWGVLIGLLKFIPYVGTWIGFSMPILLAIATMDGWTTPLLVMGFLLLLEGSISGFVEPALLGVRTGITPISVLVAALFWTWVWGPVGLLLSTPITVCLVVLGRHVRQLSVFPILFGDDPPLRDEIRLYQRLLSREPDEAIAMIEKHLEGADMISACDTLLLPAIVLWERDRAAGLLSDDEQKSFRDNLGGLTEYLLDSGGRSDNKPASAAGPEVVFVPATDDTDSMVGDILARIAGVQGLKTGSIDSGALVSETIDRVALHNGATVVVSAVPPVAPARLRYLLRKLEERGSGRRVLVGAWHGNGEWEDVSGALPKGGSARAVTTLREVLDAVS